MIHSSVLIVFFLFSLHKFPRIEFFGLLFALYFELGLKPNAFPIFFLSQPLYIRKLLQVLETQYVAENYFKAQEMSCIHIVYISIHSFIQQTQAKKCENTKMR
ncbi:hypothetical protein AABB24_000672 [Solanum stoloniferum]|uniref:Uncharacterized protein n=1 Tax=Solanum stoloniferum TaxID=62892 RepID=A0ABD2VIF7_9SOLN